MVVEVPVPMLHEEVAQNHRPGKGRGAAPRRRAQRFGLRDVEGLVVRAGFGIRLHAVLLLRMLLA